MMARACVRAGLPLRHTEGFNPRPRLALPLPRPVGIASDAERLVLELTEAVSPEKLAEQLAAHTPERITVHQARMLGPLERCIPTLVRYQVVTGPLDRETLAAAVTRLTQDQAIPYDRYIHKRDAITRVDLRPFVHSIEPGDGEVLFALRVVDGRSARPAEICDLLGIGGQNVNHRIRRLEITWESGSPATT